MIGSLRHLIVKEMLPLGGGYVITDGGYYPTCYGFVNPIVPFYDYHSVVVWVEWIESVRKDVERIFGALKNRFVWLKSSLLYHKIPTITIVCWSMTI